MPKRAFHRCAPLDTLKPVAADVWIVDRPEIDMVYLGLRLPFPTRMTVVRLPNGALWLHSPTEPTAALVAAVRALGPVGHLVAPDTLHYWWLPEGKSLFPAADRHAAELPPAP